MNIAIDTDWKNIPLAPQYWPLLGVCKHIINTMPKPVITKHDIEALTGGKVNKALVELRNVVDFTIANHSEFFIKLKLVEGGQSQADTLAWFKQHPEFTMPRTNRQTHILQQAMFEIANGRFLQSHLWSGEGGRFLTKTHESYLSDMNPLTQSQIDEMLTIAYNNLKYSISLGFTNKAIKWKKGSYTLDAVDFIIMENSTGYADSLFLQFLAEFHAYRIPAAWQEFVKLRVAGTNYAGLLEAAAFTNYLEDNWNAFVKKNNQFLAIGKPRAILELGDAISSCNLPRLALFPFPDPDSMHYKQLAQELLHRGIDIII